MDNHIRFKEIHKVIKERIIYKKICPQSGEKVKVEDIIKGFQYGKDRYVIITDDDIERTKTEMDKSIQIIHVTRLECSIDSLRNRFGKETV